MPSESTDHNECEILVKLIDIKSDMYFAKKEECLVMISEQTNMSQEKFNRRILQLNVKDLFNFLST